MELLEVSDISFQEGEHTVLHPLSFRQPRHRKLALVGESGAGKSTLLQVIAGLVQPTTGEVRVLGRRVRGPAIALVPGHPGVAYLSQQSVLPHFLRVEQVLRYASKRPAAEAQALYRLCRIDHLLARRTDQLSGGEQQRVALARLLLGAPELLLLDEPFSNLDRAHKQVLQTIIAELSERLGITCLLVSHDATDTLSWADELLVLHHGRLVQQGAPEHLYRQPATAHIAGLLGDYSLLTGADGQALAPTAGLAAGQALLVRPEQFCLQVGAGPGLAGTVRAVRFFGSYYEVEVALASTSIRARVPQPSWAPGAAVRVSVATGAGWPVPQPTA